MPRAGALIPFVPAQLALAPNAGPVEDKEVTVYRTVPIHFRANEATAYFQFAEKQTAPLPGSWNPLSGYRY